MSSILKRLVKFVKSFLGWKETAHEIPCTITQSCINVDGGTATQESGAIQYKSVEKSEYKNKTNSYERNGYLTREQSDILDTAMDAIDNRFDGTKYWR